MNLLYLSSIELRQICYFLAITEAGNNFTRAAEYLHIDQPPLTQRIKALEKKLKIELFDRKKRPLQLTAAGKIFLEETQLALISLDRAITKAQQAHGGEIGYLSIGIASSIANTSLLPNILQTFCDRFPDVELELRELTADRQIEEIQECRLNVGFEVFDLHKLDSQINVLSIMEESLVVALLESHPLATQEQINLIDLATEKLILPSIDRFPFYQEFIASCVRAGFQPHIVPKVKATWLITILSLVVAKIGVAILPSNVQNLQRQGVVYRPIQIDLNRQISAIWRQDHSSPVLQQFLTVVREQLLRGE
jgi:DNA-binding transcriptional LysR family regulator